MILFFLSFLLFSILALFTVFSVFLSFCNALYFQLFSYLVVCFDFK